MRRIHLTIERKLNEPSDLPVMVESARRREPRNTFCAINLWR